MKQKINRNLLLKAHRYALTHNHPFIRMIHQYSYSYLLDFYRNITKKFNQVLVHGYYPDLILQHLSPSTQTIHTVEPTININTPNIIKIPQQEIANNQYDLIISSLRIQDDSELLIKKYHQMLNPDGALLASLWTQKSLEELRWAYLLAENERSGGISPKVFNFPSLGIIGHQLTVNKYQMPTLLGHSIQLNVQSVLDLLTALQATGSSGYLHGRRKGVFKDLLLAVTALYDSEFYDEEKETVKASLEMGTCIGWKYHESQSKPKQRGVNMSMQFFDKLKEQDPQLKTYRIREDSDEPQQIK